MRKLMTAGTAGVLLLSIGACASKQAPVVEPEPVQPVVEKPVEKPKEEVVVQKVEEPKGPVPGSLEDFTVNVGDRVYFDLDQYNLDAEDRSRLQRQAAWLQSYPNVNIVVAGNCDERGTREYNLALGERRANAVRDYLVSLGVDGSRIETVSYGKERPIDPRSTAEAWAVNRNSQTQIASGAAS